MYKNIIFRFLWLALISIGFMSCSDRDKEITELGLKNVLSPYKLTPTLSNVVELDLTWEGRANADSYEVQLFIDSLQFDPDNLALTDTVFTTSFQTTLWGSTRYSARVKSLSNVLEDSGWSSGVTFKTAFKGIMLDVEEEDVTETSIIVRFMPNARVTRLVYYITTDEEGEEGKLSKPVEILLTQEQIASGIVTLEDLDPGIKYTIRVYYEKTLMGESVITTTAIEDIMLPSEPEDIDETFILLRFKPDSGATIIKYYTGTGDDLTEIGTITLSEEQIASGQVLFDNLLPDTAYTFEAYKGSLLVGKSTITTLKAGNIIFPAEEGDIEDDSILLKFKPNSGATTLTYYKGVEGNLEEIEIITLTEEQISSGEILFENLESNTPYTFHIYKGQTLIGQETFTTLELVNLIYAPQEGDIDEDSILLRFKPNARINRIEYYTGEEGALVLVDVLMLTPEQTAAGNVLIEGLNQNTTYTFKAYRGDVEVGISEPMTTLTLEGTLVTPDDDLKAMVEAASPNDIFLLMSGNYDINSQININVPLTIKAKKGETPIVNARFEIFSLEGNTSFTAIGIIFDGNNTLGNLISLKTPTQDYGEITLNNCQAKNYTGKIFNVESSIISQIQSFNILNSTFNNITSAIDIRKAYVAKIDIINSTFDSVSPNDNYIRYDAGTFSGQGYASNINIANNTFYKVVNSSSLRMLYVRFDENIISFTDNIIAESAGYFSDQNVTGNGGITFGGNVYYNSPDYYNSAKKKFDPDPIIADPQFVDAANGDFTVGNPSVTAGAAQWLK